MTEKLKTVGLEPGVWRQLKLLAVENDWTLSEAVAHLLNLMEKGTTENDQRRKTDPGSREGGNP